MGRKVKVVKREATVLPKRGFVDADALIRAASERDDKIFIDGAERESIGWSPESVVGRKPGRHFSIYEAAELISDNPRRPS